MQPAPDRLATRAALWRLVVRFRREERRMAARLTHCQRELAAAEAAGAWAIEASAAARAVLQSRCDALQRSCDELAVDLAHLRLALAGARSELSANPRLVANAV